MKRPLLAAASCSAILPTSDVVACECLNEFNGVKSFKVSLSLDNRNKLLSSSIWPKNIVVRKFYTKKIHNNDRSNQNKNN